MALVLVAGFIGDKKPGTPIASGKKSAAVDAEAKAIADAAIKLPASQSQFLSTIADFETRFRSAKNELQESSLRAERRAALRRIVGAQLRIDGWLGTLTKLETDSQDKAYIAVRLAPTVKVLTWNSSLVDMQGTMIVPGTPIYASLTNMSEGDTVVVSGSFIGDGEGGLFETSITINGAMTEPDFLFRFNDIQKQ